MKRLHPLPSIPPKNGRATRLPASLLCAATVLGAPLAGAATFTVTNLDDHGVGSLRDAIASANQASGADTIVFQNGLSGTITLTTGELAVTDSLTLAGPGAARIAIDGNDASRVLRLDSANPQDKAYALSGLTIKRGRTSSVRDDDGGGGVFFELASSSSARPPITLSDMVFAGNTAAYKGGAISIEGANLTLRNVEARDNHAIRDSQSRGGGLHFSRGSATIERSRFVDNTSAGSAGGVNLQSPGVSATLADTLLQGNQATLRGGGMLAGTMTNLRIARSAFVRNALTSQTEGGALYFDGVTDAGSPENLIENSTFSGNRAQHQVARGSALAVASGNMTVRNSTFAYNVTAPDSSPGNNAGGAIWVGGGSTVRVKVQSSLFNGNTHGNANAPSDLTRQTGGSIESTLEVDHSLFQRMPAIGVITTGSANIEGDALLGELTTAHGGLTPLHPIPAESPAVDRGANPGGLATDQRGAGFVRAWSDPNRAVGIADIGAYELHGDRIFLGDFERH